MQVAFSLFLQVSNLIYCDVYQLNFSRHVKNRAKLHIDCEKCAKRLILQILFLLIFEVKISEVHVSNKLSNIQNYVNYMKRFMVILNMAHSRFALLIRTRVKLISHLNRHDIKMRNVMCSHLSSAKATA